MDLTDINDAYAVRVNPLGANPVGDISTPISAIPPPPAMSTNTDPVVILPPVSSPPLSTNPVYPETVVSDALRAQQASSTHGAYAGASAPYVDAAQLSPPQLVDAEPGYFERMGLRRREVVKLLVLAVMVTLGISLHWVGSHYIAEWIESSDFDAKQRLAIRVSYPAIIIFVIWNLKAFQ